MESVEIKVNCSKHGEKNVGLNETGSAKLEHRVNNLSELGSNLHNLLQVIGSDTKHSRFAKIINDNCSSNHSHGHQCDSHTAGHHHETIIINGKSFELCDPKSLETVLSSLVNELDACQTEGCDHVQLRDLINKSKNLQVKIKDLSFCTKTLCHQCVNEKRSTGSVKKTQTGRARFAKK